MKDVMVHLVALVIVFDLAPSRGGELGPCFEQGGGVGDHALERADAQFVMGGFGPKKATNDAMAFQMSRG